MISVIIAHHPERSQIHLELIKNDVFQQLNVLGLKGEVLVETEGSISAARNSAAQRAQGNVLVFLDDDVKIRAGFFREILMPFQDPAVGIVGGVNVAFPDLKKKEEISAVLMSSPLLWFRSTARYTPRGGVRLSDESEICTCCLAILKTAFFQAGCFPLDVIPCEENVLINRIQALGWKVIYNPFAIVFHRRSEFPWGYARKMFHYGTGRGLMMRNNLVQGSPRMIWKPRWRWALYALGILIHFSCYIAGVFYGYFIKKKYRESDEKK